MNSWGQAYQTNSGAGVLGITPYGPGVFQGTALTAGRTCARYYRHFHSEQGKWIQNTGTKYDGHYISELIYTETDPNVAYAQSDQCWLLDGLWMAGGSAPSVGLQGPGDPNPGQGKNRLVQPDLMERWQDSVFSFHIKDLRAERPGHAGRGTSATRPVPRRGDLPVRRRAVGDGRQPGHGSVPEDLRAVPASGVPRVPVRARRQEQHGHEQRLLEEAVRAGVRHVRQARARSATRTSIRAPFADAEHDRRVGGHDLVSDLEPLQREPVPSRRSATVRRARSARRSTNGKTEIGQDLNVAFRGTWSRFNETDADQYSYLWLRDGTPINALYNGAPIQGWGVRDGQRSLVHDPEGGLGTPAQLSGDRVQRRTRPRAS